MSVLARWLAALLLVAASLSAAPKAAAERIEHVVLLGGDRDTLEAQLNVRAAEGYARPFPAPLVSAKMQRGAARCGR